MELGMSSQSFTVSNTFQVDYIKYGLMLKKKEKGDWSREKDQQTVFISFNLFLF